MTVVPRATGEERGGVLLGILLLLQLQILTLENVIFNLFLEPARKK